jgi:hypothetical protein
MKTTPEGKVKKVVKLVIATYAPYVYSHWPVLNGMGEPTLDCNGNVGPLVFYVETKAPGEKPTLRQWITIRRMQRSGAPVFILDGDPFAMAEFAAWLRERVEPVMELESYDAS